MRDPNRIPVVIEALRAYWLAHPDMRLGQIVSITAAHMDYDPFYLEDDELLTRIMEMWNWDLTPSERPGNV